LVTQEKIKPALQASGLQKDIMQKIVTKSYAWQSRKAPELRKYF
jgi:hypothetical protein